MMTVLYSVKARIPIALVEQREIQRPTDAEDELGQWAADLAEAFLPVGKKQKQHHSSPREVREQG